MWGQAAKEKRVPLTPAQTMDAAALKGVWDRKKRERKISQKALAAQYDCNPSLISQHMKGYTALNTEWKLRYAKYLHCSVAEIWEDFEFTEVLGAKLPKASEEAALLVADLDEDKQKVVLDLLRTMPKRAA